MHIKQSTPWTTSTTVCSRKILLKHTSKSSRCKVVRGPCISSEHLMNESGTHIWWIRVGHCSDKLQVYPNPACTSYSCSQWLSWLVALTATYVCMRVVHWNDRIKNHCCSYAITSGVRWCSLNRRCCLLSGLFLQFYSALPCFCCKGSNFRNCMGRYVHVASNKYITSCTQQVCMKIGTWLYVVYCNRVISIGSLQVADKLAGRW